MHQIYSKYILNHSKFNILIKIIKINSICLLHNKVASSINFYNILQKKINSCFEYVLSFSKVYKVRFIIKKIFFVKDNVI